MCRHASNLELEEAARSPTERSAAAVRNMIKASRRENREVPGAAPLVYYMLLYAR